MATINYLIKGQNNPTVIYLRFKNGRSLDATVSTSLLVNPGHWSQPKQKIKPLVEARDKDHINSQLDKLKLHLFEQFNVDNSKAYKYLNHKKDTLAERDRGKGKYENWFAFGRNQSLEKIKHKLFFPKFSDVTPSYLLNDDDDLLFYNGLAVISQSDEDLALIKKIMESRIFWYYIETTSKPYSSNYFSLNGNYINNFWNM